MKCILAICSESSSIDASTNTLSIFNVYEEFHSQTFPIAISKLTVIFLLKKEANDNDTLEASVVFTLNQDELARQPISVKFGDKTRIRLVFVMGGFLIPTPGVFKVSLFAEQEISYYEMAAQRVGSPVIQVD